MKIALRASLPWIFLSAIGGLLIAPPAAQAQATPMPGMPGMEDKKPAPEKKPGRLQIPPAKAPAAPGMSGMGKTGVSNLSPDRTGWPSPIDDAIEHRFLLIDLLEFERTRNGPNAVRWDFLGWRGGDYRRTWFKTEGRQNLSGKGEGFDAQLLYGKLIAPFFDVQAGVRYDQRTVGGRNRPRVLAVLGLQGLAPYRFDIEPTLFLSQDGQISASFTGTYDVLLSQRLILQPRFEADAALQSREKFGIGSGLNNMGIGFRLRYEIRRDFAPYVGVSFERQYGGSANFAQREGEAISRSSVVGGVRMWF